MILVLAVMGCATAVQAQSFSEDAVRAAYLFRFAGYVNWPEEAQATGPFLIAVLGAPTVAQELQRLRAGHQIEGRPIEVREVHTARDVGKPQILYVGPGHAQELRLLSPELAGSSILLVTDEEEGLNWGSVLNFVELDHRVRFEVSLTAAERAHLKISADLLTVAVRVRGGRRQTRDSCMPQGMFDDDSGCAISLADAIEQRGRAWAHRWKAPG
jgi:hypothetical protein